MSDDQSETQQRFDLPTPTTADTGDVRGDVDDGLPSDLTLAAEVSEPFTPVIHGNELPAGTSASEMIRAELAAARFRMSPRAVAGYEVEGVDDFMDGMGTQVRSGEDVLTTIQNMRFPMARRRMDGYDVGDVDSFLDRLEILAGGGDAGPHVEQDNTFRWRNLAGAGAVALALLVLLVFLLI